MSDFAGKLWSDLKTDAERAAFIRSGRAFQSGIMAEAIAEDVAVAFESKTVIRAALRLGDRQRAYRAWANSGGENECPHGIAKGIPCFDCDDELVRKFLEKYPDLKE